MYKELLEQKEITLQRDNFICQKCQTPNTFTVAHKISKSIANKKIVIRLYYEMFRERITMKKATDILNHNFNLITACNGNCNDSYNCGNNPSMFRNIILLIHSMGHENLSLQEIEENIL